MTSIRLYGEKARCFWCGKTITQEPCKIELTSGKEHYDVLVCSPACEQKSRDAVLYVKKRVPFFLVGVIGSVLLIAIPHLHLPTTITGFVLLGTTIVACPFCTPLTTEMLGMKKNFMLGRLIGTLLLAGTLGFVIFKWLS